MASSSSVVIDTQSSPAFLQCPGVVTEQGLAQLLHDIAADSSLATGSSLQTLPTERHSQSDAPSQACYSPRIYESEIGRLQMWG